MVFDKTGTLTHGKPVVTRVVLFVAETMCPHQLFTAIVGLAENNSEHPLGVAITNFAKGVSLICNHIMHDVTCVHEARVHLPLSLPPSTLPPSTLLSLISSSLSPLLSPFLPLSPPLSLPPSLPSYLPSSLLPSLPFSLSLTLFPPLPLPPILSFLFSPKVLGDHLEGECMDFEAVPGHGLKCKVTGVEGYVGGAGKGNAKIFSRQPCVTMTTPLVGSNKESRTYQVSCSLHPFLYMCLMDTLCKSA